MMFRVRRPFMWEGQDYEVGDVIDIPENHPRLNAMVNGSRHIVYDATVEEPTHQPTAWGHEF